MINKLIFIISYAPIRLFANLLPAKKALILLLSLQKRIITLISDRASDYEGGVHPKHRLMHYHDFFTERIKPGERVLDIGSGIGYLAYDMAKAGALVTGIELSQKNIEKANKLYKHPNLKFIHGDAWRDLPKESFDTVVMSNVLEHINNRVRFIQMVQEKVDAKRWLVRVPCFDRDWQVPLAEELGLDSRLDETHFIEFTNKTFKEEIGEAGLKISFLERCWGEIWAEVEPKQPPVANNPQS